MEIKIVRADMPPIMPAIGKDRYKLLYGITIIWTKNGKERSLVIPKNSLSDGSSIPKGFRWLIGEPFHPKFCRAAWYHDYMVYNTEISVNEMSEIFRMLLLEDGVSPFKARIKKMAVRGYINFRRRILRKPC